MKVTTNLKEQETLKVASLKAERLCKLYKCGLLDLIVLSIDKQAEIKKEQNKN